MKDQLQKEKVDSYWNNIATILPHIKRFRKAISDIRDDWKIPTGGLSVNERASWYASQFTNPDVDLEVSSYYDASNQSIPPNKFIRDSLMELTDEFNLDSRWHFGLFMHIVSNNLPITIPWASFSFEVRFNDIRLPIDEQVVTKMWIELGKDTTQEDISDIWHKVEEYQAMMEGSAVKKRRPIQDESVERYIKIRQLEDEGKSHNDIAQNYPELKFLTYKEVADFKKSTARVFKSRRKKK